MAYLISLISRLISNNAVVHYPLLTFFNLSDIMDLRRQSSAMCIIMLGGEDTHPWSATKVGNHIPANIPVKKTTNKLLKPATMQSTGRIFLRSVRL